MRSVDIGNEFSKIIVNRANYQGNGRNTATEFRNQFLSELEDIRIWKTDDPVIELDFSSVRSISTSFANELFAYYLRYTTSKDRILRKIKLTNLSPLKKNMIEREIEKGYKYK